MAGSTQNERNKTRNINKPATELANGLSSALARGHNENDLKVLNFLELQILRSRREIWS